MSSECRFRRLDCTGCGNCADICPGQGKTADNGYLWKRSSKRKMKTINSRRALPSAGCGASNRRLSRVVSSCNRSFEFSGACAGCGETPYVKLVTQLFGDRMIVANATGCSSIYGGSAPTNPYTVNEKGHGPAWANSLFEDNAEFGYGMNLALTQRRKKLADLIRKAI